MMKTEDYKGFEIGPIRPPSEATSLMLRITRNCSWNKCTFCRLYKGQKFSIREVEHVFKDLDLLDKSVSALQDANNFEPLQKRKAIERLKAELGSENQWAYYSAENWIKEGCRSVFLQDANSMIIKPTNMIAILQRIRSLFPMVERITAYSRSHTLARISDDDLLLMAEAGLNRIHIGMETACDEVLDLIKKGVDKKTHIIAGQKVKKAGIELSEYYMPGLGGQEYTVTNATETADALNQINPDFIRLRTLAIPNETALAEDYKNGTFTRTSDTIMVKELLIFIKSLNGITSTIKSDHVLNLIQEVDGTLPKDKPKIINALQWYLNLSRHEQILFSIGRRTGIIHSIHEFSEPHKRARIEQTMAQYFITESNADKMADELMKRFI